MSNSSEILIGVIGAESAKDLRKTEKSYPIY
jgi:hypothetical protein